MKAAKQNRRVVLQAAFLAISMLCMVLLAGFAHAAENKMVGSITKIEWVGNDAKTATVTLKDNDSQKEVVLIVADEETLDKLKDHRIVEGDEIRCKYKTEDGKNIATYFRKTAGC